MEVGATLADVVNAILAWTTGGAMMEEATAMLMLVLAVLEEVETIDDEVGSEEGEAI